MVQCVAPAGDMLTLLVVLCRNSRLSKNLYISTKLLLQRPILSFLSCLLNIPRPFQIIWKYFSMPTFFICFLECAATRIPCISFFLHSVYKQKRVKSLSTTSSSSRNKSSLSCTSSFAGAGFTFCLMLLM